MEGNSNISIRHPEAWHLLVGLGRLSVSYVLYTPSVDGSLTTGEVRVGEATTPLQALEDTVCDTPLLLDEYGQVRVVVDVPHFVLLPSDVSQQDAETLLRAAYPDDDGDVCVCAPCRDAGVTVVCLLPRGLRAFIDRTFNYPTIYHRLTSLCEWFVSTNHGDKGGRMLLNMRTDGMDMVIARGGALQCATSYATRSADDAAYYALNAWRTYGLDQLTDEMQLTGSREVRAQMSPLLRRYVKYVMPAIYPAEAMRLGRNAMQAPLELILLALLCES